MTKNFFYKHRECFFEVCEAPLKLSCCLFKSTVSSCDPNTVSVVAILRGYYLLSYNIEGMRFFNSRYCSVEEIVDPSFASVQLLLIRVLVLDIRPLHCLQLLSLPCL